MESRPNRGMRKRAELASARKLLDMDVVKGMANALRNQILAILAERKASATEISEELGIEHWQASYEIEVLKRARLVEKVGQRKRRGAIEVFYKATTRAYLDPSEWPAVADPIKAGLRSSLFHNLLVDAATAIFEEVYDSLPNAHMSWTPAIVDEQGWKELMELLLRTLERVLEIHEECAERLSAADAKGISCTVSILGYPSAVKKRRVGLPIDVEDLIDFAELDRRQVKEQPEPKGASKDGKKKSHPQGKTKPKTKRKTGGKLRRKKQGK